MPHGIIHPSHRLRQKHCLGRVDLGPQLARDLMPANPHANLGRGARQARLKPEARESAMPHRILIAATIATTALIVALSAPIAGAQVFDLGKYPNLKGQWTRAIVPGAVGQPPHDPSKPPGRGQQAPLTPEYQAVFEANLSDQAAGGQGNDPTYVCLPNGMPRAMSAYEPIEFIITAEITYVLIDHIEHTRRIYTDGRDWPADIEPSFLGYSIGKWLDNAGDGRFDMLEVETHGFKGPRVYDATGIPLHADNQTVIKERLYLDKVDQDLLHDEITSIDDALTRPWTVTKSYRRNPNPRPVWREFVCAEGNNHIEIAGQAYFLSAEGLLMPTKKGQPAPDLRYFGRPSRQ